MWKPAPATAEEQDGATALPEIVDTNVHLFDWPFRKLKYGRTDALVAKLRRHRITQAWAGSFECVLHKQLDRANQRLADECRTRGAGMLIPVGSVSPARPDWAEDLRRCHEQYGMRAIRLYPAYHGYTLDHPEFARLLGAAAERGMPVQIALRMEDERVHHPAIEAPLVSVAALPEALQKHPRARVQLINAAEALRGNAASALLQQSQVVLDIAALEGNGAVGRLLAGTHNIYRRPLPADRLLFGSHAPFFPLESALFKLFESPLTLEQLNQLMHANARQLLAG
jgi:predicted TIM-barrel fold metal-dependent hydrolase